jgi:hypothetical protein
MTRPLKIGVVGFSQRHFDQDAARAHLRRFIVALLARPRAAETPVELVSGLTNQGVPQLAYVLATELGLRTVGISARQALRARAGCFPVDEQMIVGERYGDESQAFVDHVDVLIRVGGGPQSRREVELFRAKHRGDEAELEGRLFEAEVEWFGRGRR